MGRVYMSKITAVGKFMHRRIKNLQHVGSVGLEDTESGSQLSKAIIA